ncbi:MAG TPA: SCO family protein [Gammaproteobacteria bacterium]
MSIAKNKIILPAALLAIIAALSGVFVYNRFTQAPSTQQLQTKLLAATLYPDNFRPLGTFKLTAHDGRTFDNNELAGRWNLVFFGFTYCPDVCPLTLQTLRDIVDTLAAHGVADRLRVIFVSVDPERDTPERLRKYAGYFHPDFIGVTGPHENLQALTSSLGVFYSRTENPENPAQYQVDHSASLFLIDGNGKIRALFSAPLEAQAIAQDLLILLQQGV